MSRSLTAKEASALKRRFRLKRLPTTPRARLCLSDRVMDEFTWMDTKQGYEFWESIYAALGGQL